MKHKHQVIEQNGTSGTYMCLRRNDHICVISVDDGVYTIIGQVDYEDEDTIQLIIDLDCEFKQFRAQTWANKVV